MSYYDSSDDEVDGDEDGETNDDVDATDNIEATIYRKSGEKGTAKSTVTARNAALNHFNDFLKTKRLPTFEMLSEAQLCNKSLWQEYGTYLSEFARQKNKVSYTRVKGIIV